jgi:hypothetical protein
MINIFRNQQNSQYSSFFCCYYLYENKLQHVCRPCRIIRGCVYIYIYIYIYMRVCVCVHIHTYQAFVYKTSSKTVNSFIVMSCIPCRNMRWQQFVVRLRWTYSDVELQCICKIIRNNKYSHIKTISSWPLLGYDSVHCGSRLSLFRKSLVSPI